MSLKIKTLADAINIEKENKTKVSYYLFSEYEIHICIIPKNSVQEWHYHTNIEEVILVVEGQVKVSWLENNKKYEQDILVNQLVQVSDAIHTFSNDTDEDCKFIVFRLVLDGIDKKELIKKDKVIIEDIDKLL